MMQQLLSTKSNSEHLDEYYIKIRQHIEKCLIQGPQPLTNVIRACEGAFPTLVIDCLQDISSKTAWTNVEAITLTTKYDSAIERSVLDKLEGNPILCSWYFTVQTCQRIEKLRDWSNLRLAFLGTPRLYDWFRFRNLGKERLLLDLDALVLEKLSPSSKTEGTDTVDEYDVGSELPDLYHGRFDFVFFDPPWYPDDYLAWLGRASLLAPGGQILFSLFPELTRPSAADERNFVLQICHKYARDLKLLSSFLDYEVPSYELAQLNRAGLGSIGSWRVADLVIAQLDTEIHVRGENATSTSLAKWEEIDIGSLRVFINFSTTARDNGCILSSLSDGSITLRSPSRREPRRKEANVLTSRGHGLITARPLDLIAVLDKLRNSYKATGSVQEEIQKLPLNSKEKNLLADILVEV